MRFLDYLCSILQDFNRRLAHVVPVPYSFMYEVTYAFWASAENIHVLSAALCSEIVLANILRQNIVVQSFLLDQ